MKLAKVKNNNVEIVDARKEWPNVSFSKGTPDSLWMQENSVVPFAPAPSFDSTTQKRVRVTPFLEDGKCQQWHVVSLTEEDINALAERERLRQISAIEREFQEGINALKANYSEEEILTWPQQKDEAKAFLADPAADIPLIQAMSDSSGDSVELVVSRINEKVLYFAQESGRLLGEKKKAMKDLTTN